MRVGALERIVEAPGRELSSLRRRHRAALRGQHLHAALARVRCYFVDSRFAARPMGLLSRIGS